MTKTTPNSSARGVCAHPNCGADISHKRRGTLYCSRSCRDKVAYAYSERHKAAEERRAKRPPAKLSSIVRQEKRRWAKEKRERLAEVDLEDPLGFRAYSERRASADEDEATRIMRDTSLPVEERLTRLRELREEREAQLKALETELFGAPISEEEWKGGP